MATLRNTLAQERAAFDNKWSQEYGDKPGDSPDYQSTLLHPEINRAMDAGSIPQLGPEQLAQFRSENSTEAAAVDAQQAPPATVHATNIPETAQKWKGEGVDNTTFIAEKPSDAAAAKEAGVTDVRKSVDYQEPAVPTQPSAEQLDGMRRAEGFWNQIVTTRFAGKDPTAVNAVEAGLMAKKAFTDKHATEFLDPSGANYAKFDKAANEVQKDAENRAKFAYESAWKIKGEVFKFAASKEARDEEQKHKLEAAAIKAERDKKPTIEQAHLQTQHMVKEVSNWNLPPGLGESEKKSIKDGTSSMPTGSRMKPEKLAELNTVRQSAGMAPMKEVASPMDVTDERNYGLFKTGGTKRMMKYDYVEDKSAPRGGAPGGAQGGGAAQGQFVVGKQYPGTGKYAGKTGTYMGNGQWQIQ